MNAGPDRVTRLLLKMHRHQRTCVDCQLLESHWLVKDKGDYVGLTAVHEWEPGCCAALLRIHAKLQDELARYKAQPIQVSQ